MQTSTSVVEHIESSKPKVPKAKKTINIPKIDTAALVSGGVTLTPAPTQELAKYQKMTDKEHILKKPDTYIGSIEMTEAETFVYDSATSSIVQRAIHYIPGLYKLFDEGAVNSRDHFVRQEQAIRDAKPNALPVTCIEFEISEDGTISITNDGNGIDVAQHPDHKLWIPEMIFGHLRTSTNYDENKKEKIVGGKNGFGFKLVLIWSSWGRVETVDHVRGLKYIQEFKNNLDEICPPKITKCTTTKPYTKVSFRPDYARFGIEGLTPDMRALFEKRIYDIAAITDKSVKVKYNGALIPVKHFQQYIDLYIGAKGETKRIYEAPDPRWEYVVSLAPNGEFQHVSFVNGIYTQKGGKHVEYIMNQIVRKLTEYIKTKKKVDVKPTTIKEQLAIFLRCDIDNPSFSSQSKDEMGTAVASFGSTCKVSDEFVEKLAKMGVMDAACALTEVKENKAAKKTDGTKTRTIRGIPKLIDANFAGTEKSAQCTIIFCEGDSAKAGIVSGLSREDRNLIGVYPMKGKMMNTRGEAVKKVAENHEITEIKQILGLEVGRKYTPDDVKYRLRYGKVLFMTDQDLDGSHIKGLGINLFQNEWASLTEIPGFIGFMNTPILKAKKGTQEKVFYNEGEYRAWKEATESTGGGAVGVSTATHAQPSGWTTKYYKGLGTSTGKEFKEYFEHKKIVDFTHSGEACDNAIDMVFNKKRADDRKTWLATYSRDRYLDTLQPSVTYEKFINDEMIHFSKYDCDRSIPNLMDGLKISLRKILFSAFKKNLKTEIKVAQFSGYVSEHSGYHHGEASLNAAIVGMAQNFVGSNNINLFEPNGQFGCIDPETPVFLWNGTIEKAKNIKVGDKLIGDDGESRIVSKLTEGVDEMYEVSNGNMDNYIVNSHHILTVCYSGHKSIFWKESSKSWHMSYFDDTTKKVKSISSSTVETATGKHFNKSRLSKEDAYKKVLEFSNTVPDNNIFDINVQQYLSLPSSVKKHVKGIINTSVIQWEEQELPIDPYILGLWLGDGMSKCNAFASMDTEIIKSWAIWTDTIGCEICHVKNIPPHENHSFYIRRRGSSKEKIPSIGDATHSRANCIGCLTSKHICNACDWTFEKQNNYIKGEGKNSNGHNVVNLNPVTELFKKHNLYNNKHVPDKYIVNSEENRLKLLAGMIDTDGCLKKQNDCYCYEISQCEKRKYLLESFRIIAGSLGFRAKLLKAANNMFSLLITGDNIHKIPVKLPRKQIINQKRLRNNYTHQIEIKSIGRGPFCGWNIDKNERFLLGDFTITHNTRLQAGADSASERYIFTQLNKLTRLIYRSEDDAILTYLDDDGQSVEPIYYVPIIPMVLVNGTKGIGTGFSTDIMCYNPAQIIAYIRHKLVGASAPVPTIEPFYKNFKGTIRRVGDTKYLLKGCYTILDEKKIRITELPVGTWTDNYKKFLENLIEPPAAGDKGKDKDKDKDGASSSAPIVKEYNDMSTDTHVDITVTMAANIINTYSQKATEFECNMLEKVLGLYTTQSTTNMNLFDAKEKLIKYSNAEEIVDSYSVTRLEFYGKRKDALIAALRKELMVLSNRARYITELLEDKIDLRRKTNKQLVELLKERKYDSMDAKDAGSDENGGDDTSGQGQQGYKYLLKLPMDSVSEENVKKLLNEKEKKEKELSELSSKTVEQMWIKDLEELEVEYNKFVEATTYPYSATSESTAKAGGGGGKAKKVKSK
jgi:DNA gyrase/topoisomerase IV subunit B